MHVLRSIQFPCTPRRKKTYDRPAYLQVAREPCICPASKSLDSLTFLVRGTLSSETKSTNAENKSDGNVGPLKNIILMPVILTP